MDKRKKGVTNKIPKEVLKIIKKNKIKVGFALHHKEEEVKYEAKTFLRVYQGFDAFENLYIVRNFIQEKYDIPFRTLEVLLYLYPKQYFTVSDYFFFPRNYSIRSVRVMLKKGYFSWVMKPENIIDVNDYLKMKQHPDGVFTLSPRSKKIVVDFYKYLCGEKKMDLNDLDDTVKDNNLRTARLRVAEFINSTDPSETKKALYKKNSDL